MKLEHRALLILVPALVTALALYPRYGPELALLGGGWVFSTLTAYVAVPPLAKREVEIAQLDPKGKMAELRKTERESVVAEIRREVKAELEPFTTLKAELQPLTRRVKFKDAEGKDAEGCALDLTMASVVNAVNDQADFLTKQDGLALMLHNAVAAAMGRDYATEMGAKGNAAQRASAAALGDQAADAVRYQAAHPELAQQGLRVAQAEEAIGEALGMMGVKEGGAIRKWATSRATENLALGGPPGQPLLAGGAVLGKQGPVPL